MNLLNGFNTEKVNVMSDHVYQLICLRMLMTYLWFCIWNGK